MTVAELLEELKKYPADMTVRYCYDTGHAFPTFKRVYLMTDEWECQRAGNGNFVCLDENE